MIRPALLLAGTALLLAGCGRSGEGTSVTINGEGGNVMGAVDGKTGEVKLDLPGFQGSIKLPRVQLDAGNFDLNGVRLYPGSTIENVDIAGSSQRNGGIRIAFASPAAAPAVRDWFRDRLSKAGYTVTADGRNLVGTTDEKKPFRLELQPDGDDRARGTIVIGG